MENIDVVVPYVDSNDPEWQKLFDKYNPCETKIEGVNAENRFRGQGDFFRYFFRCIDANMSWINKIHLLVQSESQIPNWLNRNRVHIVLHKDFIPEKYLPTFNSCTIEMFLWNIPGLSEKFIYFNDDLFVTRYVKPEDYFYAEKVAFNFSISKLSSMYGKQSENAYKIIFPKSVLNEKFLILTHSARPFLKSKAYQCYLAYKEDINNSISQFRENKNINCYIFAHYLTKWNLKTTSYLKYGYLRNNITEEKLNELMNTHILCINDCNPDINIYKNEILNKYFHDYYPYASIYELEFNVKNQNKKLLINSNLKQLSKIQAGDMDEIESEFSFWLS